MKFCREYAINGRRNKSLAMRLAGYKYTSPIDTVKEANVILRKPFADDLIKFFEMEEKAKMRISVEDVVRWFNDIATEAMKSGDYTNANRAMENLAKYLGMFVERKEITHKAVYSREELDARIAELTAVLKEAEPEIERKLRIN
jgi:acyl carrier protein phosphodiesterase